MFFFFRVCVSLGKLLVVGFEGKIIGEQHVAFFPQQLKALGSQPRAPGWSGAALR